MVDFNAYILSYKSLLSLREEGLINDEVLEAFFQLLDGKYRTVRDDYIIFNTRLYTKLTQKTYHFDLITR